MSKYTVILCENNSTLRLNAVAYFKNDNEINLIICNTLKEVKSFADEEEIHGLIVDVDVQGCREIINIAKDHGAKIILTSRYLAEEIATRLQALYHDECFYKPYSLAELRSSLIKMILQKAVALKLNTSLKNIDERLSGIFIRAGIPPHIKGYQFLREAVKLSVAYPEMINSITKKLYPAVAEIFETTPSKVQRAIRHAIEVEWNRGKIENINAIFGIKIYSKGEKPTNGELIALVADKMMIELM